MLAAAVAIVIALFVLLAVLAATKPGTVNIRRQTTIKAPPEVIFPLISDFHHWHLWAPQDRADQTMTRTYGGNPYGIGSTSRWQSKGSAGSGQMEIVGASPPNFVRVKVDFVKPFEAHNINDFELRFSESTTIVIWTMNGSRPFALKLMSVFASPDRLMGPHFEAGLKNLKQAAEGAHD
jgi:uncharacterized protein YndB with AHSA1/START domain